MVNANFAVSDHVARIEIQREEALNAVDSPTKREIIDRLWDYKTNDDVRAVLFESEGDQAFCAGGDIGEIPDVDYSLKHFTESWEELFDVMTGLGKPTVAAIDGHTLGGGFDLMLHTDIPIAADDAQIGQPEVGLGIVNHFSPPMLLQMVGLKKMAHLMMTGETISGARADEIGLVSTSVPAAQLDERVESVLESLVEKNPRTMRKLKDGIYDTLDKSPAAAKAHLESVALESAREDSDYREGIDAQLEGRPPEWVP
jgi:enoyl-CoA hydratase